MRNPAFQKTAPCAPDPVRMARVHGERRRQRGVEFLPDRRRHAWHVDRHQPGALTQTKLGCDHLRCLGKQRCQAAIAAIGINGGQGPCRLDPQPATACQTNLGLARGRHNLIPVGVKGVSLIVGHRLDMCAGNSPANTRPKIATVMHTSWCSKLAGITPPFINQRRHAGQKINAIASRPAQDDTEAGRGSAQGGNAPLHLVIGCFFKLSRFGNAGLAGKKNHVSPDNPCTDNSLPRLAITRRGGDGDRRKIAGPNFVTCGDTDRDRRSVIKPGCCPPQFREHPVDVELMYASCQIWRMVKMMPGFADPVSMIEQRPLLAGRVLMKDAPRTAGHSRSPLPCNIAATS